MTFVEKQIKKYALEDFFIGMSHYGDLQIFGGFARDLYLKVNSPIRDIDIVFDNTQNLNLYHLLAKFTKNIKINKFKGYKIEINDIKIDIWNKQDTWAFKENLLDISYSGLEETTYLAMDSIYYNYTKQIWNTKKFDDVISKRELDIVLLENPNKELNLTKNLVQKKKYEEILNFEFEFSDLMKNEYLEYAETNDVINIYNKQISRYEEEFYSKQELYELINSFKG
ncbi:hypothetical protein ACQUEF_08405 [Vagococcus fluvialis]|uniref:hypothetical protein n=1 Tax=Vagococcus fluvialis TaxID=2738 RepID=UPI003D13A572